MNELEMLDFGNKLLEEEKAASFTTIDEYGRPHTRGIFNLRNREQFPTLSKVFDKHREDLMIYISTNTSSNKVRHIKTNPNVCICVIDTENNKGISLGGQIEIVNDEKIKEELWLDWWIRYYPKGVKDEDYTILRLELDLVEVWDKGTYKFLIS